MRRRCTRVLLLWPGTEGAAAGNFGVPQLVLMASYAQARTSARVDIVDLAAERAFGEVSLAKLLAGPDGDGYDIVALGCYSSFDYLKCVEIASIVRTAWPRSVIAAGGYHASARPAEIVFDGSPFDVCIVGEAERPLVKIIESVAGGAPIRNAVVGPDPIEDLDELAPSDWSLLARYQPVARRVASQAQLYLSRGCPFDCAFCMERAKREVSWRPYTVERAIDEVRRLQSFLDLRGWTLYIADALFGMRKSWRREFLEALIRENVPVEKIWLLIRVDLVEDEDIDLFRRANCGLGFGLESGDPGLLATIRKAGRLDEYLDRMMHVHRRARDLGLPWGANVIVGHPGETADTLRRSADFLRELFLDPRGTTGFLSVDAFRLYPGSPIELERHDWERRFGTRFHRPEWWNDGDQEFLAEWVDPSHALSYRERERLQAELLEPVLAAIPDNFVYRGPAREYFLRAAGEQARLARPRTRLHYVGRYYAWSKYLGRAQRAETERMQDAALGHIARQARAEVWPQVVSRARLDPVSPLAVRIADAVRETPRERFVPLDQLAESARDVAIPLDRDCHSTVSAMHAYARAFSLLGVEPGDTVYDLGAGTGYGSALLAHLVGASGRVEAIEIEPVLVERARALLVAHPNVRLTCGDVADSVAATRDAPSKLYAGFAVSEMPPAWLADAANGTTIVAPVFRDGSQRIARAQRREGQWHVEWFEPVIYVEERRSARLGSNAAAPGETKGPDPEPTEARRPLPVVDGTS